MSENPKLSPPLCRPLPGCNERCTYCVVPSTRGTEQSRQPEAIYREVQELAAQGYVIFSYLMIIYQCHSFVNLYLFCYVTADSCASG